MESVSLAQRFNFRGIWSNLEGCALGGVHDLMTGHFGIHITNEEDAVPGFGQHDLGQFV